MKQVLFATSVTAATSVAVSSNGYNLYRPSFFSRKPTESLQHFKNWNGGQEDMPTKVISDNRFSALATSNGEAATQLLSDEFGRDIDNAPSQKVMEKVRAVSATTNSNDAVAPVVSLKRKILKKVVRPKSSKSHKHQRGSNGLSKSQEDLIRQAVTDATDEKIAKDTVEEDIPGFSVRGFAGTMTKIFAKRSDLISVQKTLNNYYNHSESVRKEVDGLIDHMNKYQLWSDRRYESMNASIRRLLKNSTIMNGKAIKNVNDTIGTTAETVDDLRDQIKEIDFAQLKTIMDRPQDGSWSIMNALMWWLALGFVVGAVMYREAVLRNLCCCCGTVFSSASKSATKCSKSGNPCNKKSARSSRDRPALPEQNILDKMPTNQPSSPSNNTNSSYSPASSPALPIEYAAQNVAAPAALSATSGLRREAGLHFPASMKSQSSRV